MATAFGAAAGWLVAVWIGAGWRDRGRPVVWALWAMVSAPLLGWFVLAGLARADPSAASPDAMAAAAAGLSAGLAFALVTVPALLVAALTPSRAARIEREERLRAEARAKIATEAAASARSERREPPVIG